jgi:hypothetical protein
LDYYKSKMRGRLMSTQQFSFKSFKLIATPLFFLLYC